MRRSSSVSHIPVFRSDSKPKVTDTKAKTTDTKSRAKSVGRTSTKVSTTTTASASERKLSTGSGLKRSNSLTSFRRTTSATPRQSAYSNYLRPSTFTTPTLSSGCRGKSPLRSSVKKDRPVSDKKWVAEQFMKIRAFIEDHPDLDINLASNFKPPTINSFVLLVGILLNEIDSRIVVNMGNYMQVVPHELKEFKYPGTISNSLLKTVNTMHSWPQVISIISWLIDLTIFVRPVDEPIKLINTDNELPFQLSEAIWYDLHESYHFFNENEGESEDLEKNFIDKITDILQIDYDKINETETELENIKNLNENLQIELIKKQEIIKNIQLENERKLLEIEAFCNEPDLIANATIEINKLKETNQKLDDKITTLTESVEELKSVKDKQKYSINELNQVQVEIDELKHRIKLKEETKETLLKVQAENDNNLVLLKNNIESEVHRFNLSLIQPSLNYPKINNLKLRDCGFFSTDFKDEISKTIKQKEKLECEIEQEFVKLEKEITERTENNLLTKSEIVVAFKKRKDQLQLEDNELNKQLGEIEKNIKMVTIEIENKKVNVEMELNKLDENDPNIRELELKRVELEKEVTQITKNLEVLKVKCVMFFDNACNQIMKTLMEMIKIYHNVMSIFKNKALGVVAQQNTIIEELKKLDVLSDNNSNT